MLLFIRAPASLPHCHCCRFGRGQGAVPRPIVRPLEVACKTPPPDHPTRPPLFSPHGTHTHTHNNSYCTAIKDGMMVLGVTQRFRMKFVTTVYYSMMP